MRLVLLAELRVHIRKPGNEYDDSGDSKGKATGHMIKRSYVY